ncbi:MAG: PAS domain S-box protein [Planctomycetota bacterium]
MAESTSERCNASDDAVTRSEAKSLTAMIGIGASAGGLAPLETLFEQLPIDTGAAFVVIQHLSPDYPSHMAELLGRRTKMPVLQLHDPAKPEPNTVYVLPPDRHLVFDGGQLRLIERAGEGEVNLPIDRFFDTLADSDGFRIAGVVLSGTGRDGSEGIQRIRAAGGLVLCQDEDTSQFDGMPLNAIATQAVHAAAPITEIAEMLSAYAAGQTIDDIISNTSPELASSDLEPIYKVLSSSASIDFTQYKSGTFMRRLSRRIQLSDSDDIGTYLARLDNDPNEVANLTDDLLIGVTRFFRDTDGYQRLQTRAIRPALRNKKQGSEFRAWIAGCATGQEAYSVAMILHDELERDGADVELRIFATDVHPDAIRFAQVGVYPLDALSEIPPQYRSKYTTSRSDSFEFVDEIRNSIVFARHDVLQDAPFANLDLLTCRNLLIYLQEEAQKRVLNSFTHALRDRGVLWLGPSETPGEAAEAFAPLDKQMRIFQKERDLRLPLDLKLRKRPTAPSRGLAFPRPGRSPSAALVLSYDQLMARYAPPSILLDESYEPLQLFGDLSKYTCTPSGRLRGTVEDIVAEPLRAALSVALQRQRRNDSTAETERASIDGEPIEVTVSPLHHSSISETHTLVTFNSLVNQPAEPHPKAAESTAVDNDDAAAAGTVRRIEPSDQISNAETDSARDERVRMLEMELDYSRENLQATIEELETTNEELQSSNEELTSTNEELQSTNEELHSVNEELQSTNAESERRVQLLSETTADLEGVLQGSSVGIVLLDQNLLVRRITDAAADALRLNSEAVSGRSFPELVPKLGELEILEVVAEVRENGGPIEREATDRTGAPCLVRIAAYEDRQGFIITLTNLTKVRETADRLRKLTSIVSDSTDAIIGVNLDAQITSWNRGAELLFGKDFDAEIERVDLCDALPVGLCERCEAMLRRLARYGSAEPCEMEETIDGEQKTLFVRVTPVLDNRREVQSAAISIGDITALRTAERELRLRTHAIDSASNGIIVVDAKADDMPIIYSNTGFEKMTGFSADAILGRNCRFLQGPGTNQEDVDVIREAIRNRREGRVTLLNYRRDGTPFYNELIVTPVMDDAGEVTHFVGVQSDVTDRVEARNTIERSEAEYRSTFETAAVGIAHVGMDGAWLRVNDKLCDIVGYTREELKQRTFQDMTHPEDVDADLRQFGPLMRGEIAGYSMEKRYFHKDGHIVWVNLTTSLRRSESGEPECCISIVEDISERRRTERQLAETQSIVSEVIENTQDAFISFDHEGRTQVVNQAAKRLADSLDVRVEGSRYQELFAPDATGPLLRLLNRVRQSKQAESTEYLAPKLNRWYDARAFPIAGGVALYMSDVTARKDTETHLERARRAAEEASKAKTNFLTNMSHEIRSPMAAILGFSDIALRSIKSGERVDAEHVETIIRNGRFLLRIINDILDLSKVEAGKLQVRKTRFKLLPLLGDLAELMRHRSDSTGVPLAFEFEGLVPEYIKSDRSRVEQILVNLIGNALKFSPNGDVRVVTAATDREIQFRVIDTGIGIAEENLSKLFAAFSQVHDRRIASTEGTGLGLAISRRLASLLGGGIDVESEEGVGSTFTLTLPTAVAERASMIEPKASDLRPRSTGGDALAAISGRMLIADDARDIRFLGKHFLQAAGAKIDEAENGAQAVAAVRAADAEGQPYQCILMDMQMPEMNGREATRSIREEGFTAPIIALTAGATADEVQAALDAGCNQFVSKPIDGVDLVARVATLIADGRQPR